MYCGRRAYVHQGRTGFFASLRVSGLSSFKLCVSDVGLLTMKSGLPYQFIFSPTGNGYNFNGALAENYVAQALHANGSPLYYWTSDQTAEIDFVLQNGEVVVPIAVIAGTHTQSRSLSVFTAKYKPACACRISARNFGFPNGIKSVPLYAAFVI